MPKPSLDEPEKPLLEGLLFSNQLNIKISQATFIITGKSSKLKSMNGNKSIRSFIVDTDTGSDDAVALILALRHPEINVEAITIVAGNVPAEQGAQNALFTVELCESKVPVYLGATKPLKRPLKTAQFVHGEDGMGDIGLDLKGRQVATGDAVEVIYELISQRPLEIELVTLGPLTNIALAVTKYPELANMVKQCTIMGGIGRGHGNITPVAEYNIWTDPEAAKIVFASGLPLRMVGWDISRKYAWIDEAESMRIKSLNTPLAHFVIDIQNKLVDFAVNTSKLPGFDLPDPIAMAIALNPEIIATSEALHVEIILSNDSTRGQTVVDHNHVLNKAPNAEVVLEASRELFLSTLHQAIK